jgi:GIY-YIG catalytic domain/NUMOD1 domain
VLFNKLKANNMKDDNNNENITLFSPVCSYVNADLQKSVICKDNNNKTGIYKWTHIISGKSYVGSAINLSNRLRSYYSLAYLEREITKNKSMIYRALLKYGHSSFKLDILEYCNPNVLIEREQHYFDQLKPEYNILKVAGSSFGFKHSEITIKLMRLAKLGSKHSEFTKFKIAANNAKAKSVIVTNNKTGEVKSFTSIRKASKFVDIHRSYLARIIKTHEIYIGKIYT